MLVCPSCLSPDIVDAQIVAPEPAECFCEECWWYGDESDLLKSDQPCPSNDDLDLADPLANENGDHRPE